MKYSTGMSAYVLHMQNWYERTLKCLRLALVSEQHSSSTCVLTNVHPYVLPRSGSCSQLLPRVVSL